MGLLRSLPKDATMLDLFKAHAEPMARLIDFEDKLMRGPSPFSDAEREIISAFTSGLNACTYCHRSHSFLAEELGVSEAVLPALLDNIDSAPIAARLRPILQYVRKLTLTPSRLVEADATAVYDAGWDSEALFQAIAITAYFNFCNRITAGAGLDVPDTTLRDAAKQLVEKGYKTSYGGLKP